MDLEEEEEAATGGLFAEPEGFYQKEKEATFATHKLLSGQELQVRLVGQNPLWGHYLWNASRMMANHLETHAARLVHGRYVLEFGAGAGLPSLVSAVCGASRVVVSDYPDPDLISNLEYNISHCALLPRKDAISAAGYLWGSSTDHLTAHLPSLERQSGFHTLILSDLLFNHSEHAKLLKSVQETLRRERGGVALVFFTPHRPWLLEQDLAFLKMAEDGGFDVSNVFEEEMERPMFEDDKGDETLRKKVFGYELTWR